MSEDGEKQFEASQKRLADARKKGDLPRSADLTTAAIYGAMLITLVLFSGSAVRKFGETMTGLIAQSDRLSADIFAGGGGLFFSTIMSSAISLVAPWVVVSIAFTLLSVSVQRAFVVAPDKLTPKLSKLSPVRNAFNKFGRAGLFEFGKSATKLVIYGIVAVQYIRTILPELIVAVNLEAPQIVAHLGEAVVGLLARVFVVAALIGVLDLLWQNAEFRRKNMMSREEMKEEHKESEGDPALKQQRRQKAISIAMNKMLKDVETSDVVIVNPTHYAVALKWDRSSKVPPVVVAKGVDEIALKIREIASEHAVPVRPDPPTARAIYGTVDIGKPIQQDHFRAVAAAIRFAEGLKRKARK